MSHMWYGHHKFNKLNYPVGESDPNWPVGFCKGQIDENREVDFKAGLQQGNEERIQAERSKIRTNTKKSRRGKKDLGREIKSPTRNYY